MPLTVTAFCPKDADQTLRQAQWLHELGGCRGHELLLIADTACPAIEVEEIRAEYARSYDAVELLPFVDHYRSWPRSPNDCFATAARHVMRTRPQPWFFCEPDSVFLLPGALDQLWAEYQAAGKPFLGDFVSAATAGINVVDHMSGNAIYPADLFTHAGLLLIADEIAFDVAAASQIVPQMHRSELLLHRWKHGQFISWEQVQADIFDKKPNAVMFHASKDGSLIERLREHKNLPVPALADSNSGGESPSCEIPDDASCEARESETNPCQGLASQDNGNSRGGQFICNIFIKTYPPDYPWLEYCLRSIGKFASGFRKTVIVSPDSHFEVGLPPPGYEWQERMEFGLGNIPHDGYLSQQCFKLHADQFTLAEFILFTDSDTIFTTPVTPETYFTDGLVNWMITPYAKTETPWQPIIEKFLGRPVEYETMRRHPQMVPRWLLIAMREFCEQQHGMALDKYVMSQPYREFSEFNALGAFAYYFHHDRFNWINTEEVPAEQWPPLTVLQKYSHGGLTPEIEAEFKALLDAPQNAASEFVSPDPNRTAEPPDIAKDQLWVKLDANGQHVGTFEFNGTEWVPAKWPRETNDYQVAFGSVADAPRFDLVEGQYRQVNPAYQNQRPWADKESSLAEIGRLSARLKEFCTGPVRTRQVRDVLREAGVIK